MPQNDRSRSRWGVALVGVLIVAVSVSSTACSGQDSPQQYSIEELALDILVDEYAESVNPFARYRTAQERQEADAQGDRLDGSEYERERTFFETRINMILVGAGDTLPSDVARGSGVLHDALNEAKDQCATEKGWPGLQLYDISQEMGEQYERDYGLTLDMLLDLRHECSKYAATYPTLDPQYRDQLLAKRRDHYMQAVRDWIAANPELVVPVENHD